MACLCVTVPARSAETTKPATANTAQAETGQTADAFANGTHRRRPKPLQGGNYLAMLGDYDPRPYGHTHLGDKLLFGTDHFHAKNRRWLDDGLAIGGYFSPNFQGGSGAADHRELYSAAVIRLAPFGLDGDSFGFGLFAGDPSDATLGTEYGAELFYKFRLTQDVSLMPDLQYWRRNDSGGTRVRTFVYGIRINFAY